MVGPPRGSDWNMNAFTDYFRQLWRASIGGWNRFWFQAVDPATLGLIRLLGGSMILYTHCVWSLSLMRFFGPHARIGSDIARQLNDSSFAWSYLFWIRSPALLWIVHILALVVLLMFAAGLFTRITSVLAFAITVSYIHRVPGALFGLDQINGLLALYLMIGPAGAAYSLDNVLARRGWLNFLPRWLRGGAGGQEESVTANISIRLIQLHMCIIYLFAGLAKLQGETWWDGTAMWLAFANYEYQSLDMTWLASHPYILNFLTHLTVAWECSYIVLVWPRLTRPLVIALAIPLHLGIALCMGMITFGLVMLIANLAFVSPPLVRAVVDPLAVKLRLAPAPG